MHQKSFENYIAACVEVGIDPNRVMQTMGNNVAASAGTHAKDGDFDLKLADGRIVKRPYAACTDIRSKDLNLNQIHSLQRALAKRGICAYHRHLNSFANNQHIHFIWSGCKMKTIVQRQVHDFREGLNALVSHVADDYWGTHPIGPETKELIKKLFNAFNPHQLLTLGNDTEEDYVCSCSHNEDEVVPDDDVQGEFVDSTDD